MRSALAALLLTASPVALADTLIDNVSGRAIGTNGQIEQFTGLLFDDAGMVKRVIRSGDKKPKPRREYQYHIDGKGRVMLPGMIDAHAHVMGMGFAALSLDLSETTSFAQALNLIGKFAAEHPDRPWIVGRGWNQEKWGLGRFPTAAELDAVTGDRPVWLERVDGHAGWANSAALKAAGVTAATKAPAGGSIERGPDGAPLGVLVDAAMELIAAKVPPPRAEDRDVAFATAQQMLFKRGVTAVADMGTSIEDWQTYRRAGDANRLYVRVMAYAAGNDQMTLIGGPGPSPWLYQDRLRLNGVKLYLDGALGSRGAWLKAPYADAPATRGLPQLNQTQLGNLMSRAAMDGFQIAVHAIGDEANATVIGAINDLSETYKGDRRWRVEHAQIVDPKDFAKFARSGAVASMQPVHQTSDRLMAEARLGPDRLAGAYAWKSLKSAGVRLAFGSDAPVELADPWAGLAAAISREGPDGQPAGGWQPQERLAPAEALSAYTADAAWAGFAESKFGRLAPGLRADFVLVDVDPLTASAAQVRATKVSETWIGGGRVWSAEEGTAAGKPATN
ncbi:MAG: amidohydrolase family protein [Novosphingobium sp.]|uniref:amidohydrolase n=1 Tax=Novosphingobium sp. TaxID=1874826 RepID=UPI003B9D71E8